MDNFNFRLLGRVDVAPLQKKIMEGNFGWDSYQFRQQTYDKHKETKTIPLLWNEANFQQLRYWENYELFKEDIAAIQSIIEDALHAKGMLHTAILVMLQSKAKIYPHFDSAPFFRISRRIHVPVFTNPECLFTVDTETINMKEGEIWEINNDGKRHGVENNGDTDRVHLLMDWKGEG